MLKYIKFFTVASSVALVLNGCDGSDQSTKVEGIGVVLTERGIDYTSAVANPADIAELPKFFLQNDSIVHGNIASMDIRNITQLDDGDINSAGELRIDNLALTWKRAVNDASLGEFNLSTVNEFPSSDMDKVTYYRNRMDTVIGAAAGSADSINQALNNEYDSNTPFILAAAGASIGHLTSVGPELFSPTIQEPHVLMERNITYIVTSTNQDLLDTRTISGVYSYTDRWGIISLLSVGAMDDVAVFDQIHLAHNPVPFALFDVVDDFVGTFTITLQD